MKIYSLTPGSASRYYWFDMIEDVEVGMSFDKAIKNGKITLGKQSGTTEADCHGSTMAIDFFSGNFVNVLNELGVKNFKKTKMKFSSKLKVSSDYYFVELLTRLPVIQNKDMFSKPDVNKYCAEHNVNRNDLLDFSSDGVYIPGYSPALRVQTGQEKNRSLRLVRTDVAI